MASGPLFAQRSLHLAVGDPARKDKEAKVVLDAITATATGDLLTPREAVARLAGTRLIFIGESHTSMDFHLAQQRVIEELQRAGKRVLIGLEMYPYTEQKYLDDWSAGFLTEQRVPPTVALVQELGLSLELLQKYLPLCPRSWDPHVRHQCAPGCGFRGEQEGISKPLPPRSERIFPKRSTCPARTTSRSLRPSSKKRRECTP